MEPFHILYYGGNGILQIYFLKVFFGFSYINALQLSHDKLGDFFKHVRETPLDRKSVV